MSTSTSTEAAPASRGGGQGRVKHVLARGENQIHQRFRCFAPCFMSSCFMLHARQAAGRLVWMLGDLRRVPRQHFFLLKSSAGLWVVRGEAALALTTGHNLVRFECPDSSFLWWTNLRSLHPLLHRRLPKPPLSPDKTGRTLRLEGDL